MVESPHVLRGGFLLSLCMFGAIRNLCNNILALDENEVVMSAIRKPEIKRHIIYLNAFDQLFLGGLNSDGEIVGYYRNTTELMSEGDSFTFNGLTKRKIAGDAYFFYDSGGFLRSFSVSINKRLDLSPVCSILAYIFSILIFACKICKYSFETPKVSIISS